MAGGRPLDHGHNCQRKGRWASLEVHGEVREWLNRAVSKTVEPLRVPWVRIPPSPPAQFFQAAMRLNSRSGRSLISSSWPA